MEFVQTQFSLKFEPQIHIRRNVNQIEDFLEKFYGTPQTMPLPDEFAAEAPRIILNSRNGHSQISFSQISVDFNVNFDNEYRKKFQLTKEYVLQRLGILKLLLEHIGINNYYFAGITYNVHLDIGDKSPVDYMKDIMRGSILNEPDFYEISQRVAFVQEEKYFINQQIGTYKEYQGNGNNIPSLMNFTNSLLIAEGINLSLDVNNRYQYLYNGEKNSIDNFDTLMEEIYRVIEANLSKWS